MKHTIFTLVANRTGVLADLANEFKKRSLNIQSIACGETENPAVTSMVICLEAPDDDIDVITSAVFTLDSSQGSATERMSAFLKTISDGLAHDVPEKISQETKKFMNFFILVRNRSPVQKKACVTHK